MPPQFQNNFPPVNIEPKQKFPKWVKYVLGGFVVLIAVVVVKFVFTPIGPMPDKTLENIAQYRITDWKTYRNEEYGVEFKYPNSWGMYELKEYPTVIFSDLDSGVGYFYVGFSKSPIKETICDPRYEKKSFVNIGDQQNNWCIGGDPDDVWKTFINNNGTGISFHCWFPETMSNLSMCNKVLSTFKFISTSTPLGTGTSTPKIIGGDKDAGGCLVGAGYSWCQVKNKCLRVWEEKCE